MSISFTRVAGKRCGRQCAAADRGGVKVWVETLIQYLLCDKTDAEKPDFEGAKFIMSPPLREKHNQEVVVERVAAGVRVHAGGSDHAPFDFEDAKSKWAAGFHENPQRHPVAGGPG